MRGIRRTAYWIAFGPHGPRALPPPDERRVVALYTLYGIGAALGIVLIARQFAKPPPTTMTKAYQEQSNEYLKVRFPPSLPLPFLFRPCTRPCYAFPSYPSLG